MIPKPTHTRSVCFDVGEWIAVGGPCPMCHQRWIRFPDFEELLHSDTCSYISSLNYFEAIDRAVDLALETAGSGGSASS